MKRIVHISLMLIGILFCACENKGKIDQNPELGEFGAFYTRIQSEEEFEKYSRVREHPDIIVDLGTGDMTFNFWRGSSYLPYLESPKGRWYVEELVNRKGDGSDLMPDRTNTYSYVKIISSTEKEAVIHWRYLPVFEGGNPQMGVAPDKFVDEYYFIKANGDVKRTLKKGTKRFDDWNNSVNVMVQTFKLSKKGFKNLELTAQKNQTVVPVIEGNPIIKSTLAPVAWWKFDEGEKNSVLECISKTISEVEGNKTLWRKGVSGTSLQFNGYHSEIRLPAEKAPVISGAITLESWVALGAYPWSDVPIVQQLDDMPEEIGKIEGKRGTQDYRFVLKEENDKGYFLGIDGFGKPLFKLHIEGKLQQLKADHLLERNKWYHLAATFDEASGLMKIFVNGKNAGQRWVSNATIEFSEKDIRIGKGKDRRPVRPVRSNTFADSYSLDGLIDEIKIYDIALSGKQVAESYNSFKINSDKFATVDMDKRVLPDGDNRQRFGAYYTHLKFYDVWDHLWRLGNHPDVVVEFDDNPSKFIFWRGTGYIPMIVNEIGQWYSNEFNETWGKTGGTGCQEPMSDKEGYTNHARILENTPARTVVHWRYPLIDVNHVMANYNDTTGWCDWSDWYYYIYPDGVAVKSMKLWTHGQRNHEWQESMAIFGPDQHPENIIHTKDALTMMNLKGESVTYDWIGGPPDNINEPNGQCIQYINYTGKYKPVTIGDFVGSNVYGGEQTEYSVFPAWNHWPVAQMPSDGRYATYPDRTAHSSLTHLFLPVFKEEHKGPVPYYEKLLMEAMLNKKPHDLLKLAKSWLSAPPLVNTIGGKGMYAPDQRAYILEKTMDKMSFSIEAGEEMPLVNLAMLIKKWDSSKMAKIMVNNKQVNNKQGIFRDTDGTKTLAIWIEIDEYKKTDFSITTL